MKNKIKIAIIGCGGIARVAHMKQYMKLTEDYEIVAACDVLSDRAEQFAKDFGIPAFYTDYKQMLDIEELDAVDICTPNYLHSIIAVEALNRGLNVLCENADGFKIAEKDFEMRGSGDFMGMRQSGKFFNELGNLSYSASVIFFAKRICDEVFTSPEYIDAIRGVALEKYERLKGVTMN